MGIRFHCHMCNYPLNVKFFQAGRRGRCPHCNGSFRIPNSDAELSIPLPESRVESSLAQDAPQTQHDLLLPQEEAQQVAVATLTPPSAAPQTDEAAAAPSPVEEPPWFVRPPKGGVYGPADTRTLMLWISQRRVPPDSFLWREGMAKWCIANKTLPEAFDVDAKPIPDGAVPPPASSSEASADESHHRRLKPELAKAKANLDQRRKRKRFQTVIIIGSLLVIALGLIGTLVIVLRG